MKLDANEGRCVLDEAQLARILTPQIACRYPRSEAIEGILAEHFGVDRANVIATAGADDAIDRAFRALAGPGSLVLSTVPGFVEFLDASERTKARFLGVPKVPGAAFPLEAFNSAIEREKPAIAVVATPDNPAGTSLGNEEFLAIAESCSRAGTVFLLDVTYIDFADDSSIFALAVNTPGVLLTGSFSKSRGLAGFRMGWALAGPSSTWLVGALRDAGPPFSLSSPAMEAARIALKECGPRYEAFVSRIRFERRALQAVLAGMGAATWPSQANFVSVFVPDSQAFVAALGAKGVLVRHWPGKPETEGLVRITCPGDEASFETLVAILRQMEDFVWPR
jgi:histidinol-phosphate aminotransferase